MKKSIRILLILAIVAISMPLASARTSYRGFVDIDPALAISYSSVKPSGYSLTDKAADFGVAFSTTHGVQLNRHFFVGAGAGFIMGCSTISDDRLNHDLNLYAPVYIAGRWDMNIAAKVSPFVSCKLGYALGITDYGVCNIVDNEGWRVGESGTNNYFFYQPTIGIRVRMHHHVGLNLGLTLYPTHYKIAKNEPEIKYSRLNLGLNIGIDF